MKCNCNTEGLPMTRVGNDIEIQWSVFTGPLGLAPFDFAGKDVTVYVKSKYVNHEIKDIEISEGTLSFFFRGKDQYFSDIYSLQLVVNEGKDDMFTLDKCNVFELISKSCQLPIDNDGRQITTESIAITNYVEIDTDAEFGIDEDMNLVLTYSDAAVTIPVASINDDGELILH